MSRDWLPFASSLLAYACFATSAHAEPAIGPCAPGDPELARAESELLQIDAAVAALDVAADPKPLTERIQALAGTRCLGMVGELELTPTSGLSLKTYWADGGSEHLRSYLELKKPDAGWTWFPPSMRRALTLETNPDSPIRDLLCPFADTTCGVETQGWAIRAEHEFSTLAAASKQLAPDAVLTNDDPDGCAEVASQVAATEQFAKFRECQEALRVESAALPIGRTRALDHGWLIVEGRRGHYAFCDETRAYDLATGSAYRVASCSALALQAAGAVNFRATDAQRQHTLEIGHLPLQALREAAWMILLEDEVDRGMVGGVGVSVPSSMPLTVEEAGGSGMGRGLRLSIHSSSADTELEWRVEDRAKIMKSGSLTWSPIPLDDPAKEHAVTLLRVAEASLVLDCPDVPPPVSLTQSKPALSASGLDADSKSLRSAAKAIAEDWRKVIERQRACSQASGPTRAQSALSHDTKSAP